MQARYSWIVGIAIGCLVGFLFGVSRADPWLGGVLTAVWTIAGYGFFAYPEFRSRWSGRHSAFWYTLVGGLGPVTMFLAPRSRFLADELPVVVLVGGLWIGGVYAGVALARRSPAPGEA